MARLFKMLWHCLRRGGSELSPFQEGLRVEVLFTEERASTTPLWEVFGGLEGPKASSLQGTCKDGAG